MASKSIKEIVKCGHNLKLLFVFRLVPAKILKSSIIICQTVIPMCRNHHRNEKACSKILTFISKLMKKDEVGVSHLFLKF